MRQTLTKTNLHIKVNPKSAYNNRFTHETKLSENIKLDRLWLATNSFDQAAMLTTLVRKSESMW